MTIDPRITRAFEAGNGFRLEPHLIVLGLMGSHSQGASIQANGVKWVVKCGVKNDVKKGVRQRGYSCSRRSTLAHASFHAPFHAALHVQKASEPDRMRRPYGASPAVSSAHVATLR